MFTTIAIGDVRLKLGEWCRLQRRNQELTQDELAETLGMSRLTIRKLESGKNVTLDTVLKVAGHFGALEAIYQFVEKSIEDSNSNSLY